MRTSIKKEKGTQRMKEFTEAQIQIQDLHIEDILAVESATGNPNQTPFG